MLSIVICFSKPVERCLVCSNLGAWQNHRFWNFKPTSFVSNLGPIFWLWNANITIPCFSTYILLYFTWLLSPSWQLVLKGLWFRKSQWFEWCWHLFNWRRSNKLENLGQGEVRSRFSRVNVPIYRRESRSSPSMGGGGMFPTPFTLLSLAPKVLHPECFLVHWNFNIELNIKVDPW